MCVVFSFSLRDCVFCLSTCEAKKNRIGNINNGQFVDSSTQSELFGTIPNDTTIQFGDVEWLPEPQKVLSVGFFGLIDQYYPYILKYCKSETDCVEDSKLSELNDKYEPKATYYKVGIMKSQPYSGSPVYLGIVKNLPQGHVYKGYPTEKDIAYDYEIISLFIKTSDNKFIMTNDYQNYSILCRSYCNFCRSYCEPNQLPPSNEAAGIIYRHDLSLDKLSLSKANLPDGYTDPETGVEFSIDITSHFFVNSGLFLVKDFGKGYALYSNQDIKSNLISLKSVINPTFVIKLPTGLAAGAYLDGERRLIYKKGVRPYSSDDSQLVWTASEKPQLLPKEPSDKGITTDYTEIAYTTYYDGCRGNMALDNIVSNGEFLDVNNNLIKVATTDRGDTIYDLKNKDFRIFESFLFSRGHLFLGYDLTYSDYLALKPILIWKNRLGVYRMIFREDLVSSKCWAGPLIYLYPEKPTTVRVNLSKVINLTKSEPTYDDGWNLIAYPNGDIYLPKEQRKYSYLFWEGSAPVPLLPVAQEVVKKTEIHDYFERTLTKLGLDDREKQDFKKYW